MNIKQPDSSLNQNLDPSPSKDEICVFPPPLLELKCAVESPINQDEFNYISVSFVLKPMDNNFDNIL